MNTVPPHYDADVLPHLPQVPVSKYTVGEKRTQEDLITLATAFRCALKVAFEDELRPQFDEFGGEMRVYFKEVIDQNTGMHAFIKDVEIAHIPEGCIDQIPPEQGYIRHSDNDWLVIELCGDSKTMEGAIIHAEEPFSTCLKRAADIVYDICHILCDKYEHWLQCSLGISDITKVISTDQLYQALENLLQQVPEVSRHIRNRL